MYKLLSGAKSVKQYRGDENLPEAKKGMKNCGCKHSKSKYKYQDGERDLAADELEFGKKINSTTSQELDLPEGDTSITYTPPVKRTNKLNIVKPNVVRNTSVVKKEPVKTFPTVRGERKINMEKPSVSKRTTYSPYDERKTYSSRVKKYINNSTNLIPDYKLVNGKPVRDSRFAYTKNNIGFKYEDLTPQEQKQVQHENKLRRAEELRREVDIQNKSAKYRKDTNITAGLFNKEMENRAIPKLVNNIKKFTSSIEGKSAYKYGTGALAIPEGSAIVTAQVDKRTGKKPSLDAIRAYKKGNYKLLNNIIDDMPEDNVDKAQAGAKEVSMFDLSNFTKPTPGFYRATRQGKGYGKYKAPDDETQKQREYEYEKDPKAFEKKYGKIATSLQKERMEAFKAGKEDFTWSDDGNLYKSGFTVPAKENKTIPSLLPNPNLPNGGLDLGKRENVDKKPDGKKDNINNKRKGFDVPSLAEIAARSSILGQGVEGVAENYLKLGRYNYASQLPKTLQEIALAEQGGRNAARDVVAGDAGRYLAQSGSLSAARMKASNDAVIQDTLARQDILNKNVDLGNVESKTNTELKNQYAELRGKARSAYNDQLVSLGQRIDSASETAQEMSNQKAADAQRLQILKDLGQNYQYQNVDGINKLVPKVPVNTPPTSTAPVTVTKKGAKKLKTYKRK